MIKQQDALEFLKDQTDYSADLIYQDPPYALGSEIVIRSDGKVDYKKASDFMSKWDMPTGEFWEDYFKEALRTLKYGGHCIMFGMDRQTLIFKYYAALAGFIEKQSLYWLYISAFPKATDLAKGITAQQRVGKGSPQGLRQVRQGDSYQPTGQKDYRKGRCFSNEIENDDRETELTPLAQKYSGYKYSIAPLKQTNETIMIFQKPYKTGSCLYDTLKMEAGDQECTCGALNIENSRVATKDTYNYVNGAGGNTFSVGKKPDGTRTTPVKMPEAGRYPAQTYVNEKASQRLDEMSRVRKGSGKINYASETHRKGLTKDNPVFNTENSGIDVTKATGLDNYGDTGGCSKVLHRCDFEKEEHDLYFYCPKVSKKERNAGCDELKDSTLHRKNNHPTAKPISLNYKILSLFKTPSEQRILIPFAGSGSEIIGAIKAGYTNWDACEINADYVKIAEARIKYWSNKFQEDNKQAKLI